MAIYGPEARFFDADGVPVVLDGDAVPTCAAHDTDPARPYDPGRLPYNGYPVTRDQSDELLGRLRAGETVVINVRDRALREAAEAAGLFEYVGRRNAHHRLAESRYRNEFPLSNPRDDAERAEVIARYAAWVRSDDRRAAWIRAHVHELRGKALGCWCAPKPCHGDALAAMAEESAG